MGRQTNQSKGIITPFKQINEDKLALEQLYNLRLFKVFIINDTFTYCSGDGIMFMNQLDKCNLIANKQLRDSLKQSFKLQTIEGFKTKLDAINYCKQHYPNLTMIRKLLAEGDECHYKILLQLDPDDPTNILIVYPNFTKFIKENNLGFHTFGKYVDGTTLMGGYYWMKTEQFNYPPTVDSNQFKDILNLNQPLPVKAIANRFKTKKP